MTQSDLSTRPHRLIVVAGWLSVLLLCLAGPARAAGPGEKVYNEMKEKEQLYQDEEWQSYVDEIGQRLLAVSPHAGKDYHFYVIDNSTVNASAFPDAYILVIDFFGATVR